MEFYIIPHEYANSIPFEAYKNNTVVVSWVTRIDDRVHYSIKYDYTYYFRSLPYTYLVMYNLTDEDLTYLNLMGIPFKSERSMIHKPLEEAIKNGSNSFYFIDEPKLIS